LRGDAISPGGSKLVHFWFIFPDRRIKVPSSCELGPLAGDVHDNGNDDDTDACVAGCTPAACGDGHLHAGAELCDDGNQVNNDGCDSSCKPTPPECLNAVALGDAFRNVSNLGGPAGCDNPMVQQWYRFTGPAGVKMATSPPAINACGTNAPGWLSGREPQPDEGAVARQVCFNWNANTCNWSEPAMVRNCGGEYLVYFLKNISWGCNGRYCGAD